MENKSLVLYYSHKMLYEKDMEKMGKIKEGALQWQFVEKRTILSHKLCDHINFNFQRKWREG